MESSLLVLGSGSRNFGDGERDGAAFSRPEIVDTFEGEPNWFTWLPAALSIGTLANRPARSMSFVVLSVGEVAQIERLRWLVV